MFWEFGTKIDFANCKIIESDNGVLLLLRAVDNNKSLAVLKAVFDGTKALLGDIDIPKKYVNHGLGSKLIKRFEEICLEKGITEINGNLSNTDVDHKERLLHFYGKHGYEIDYVDEQGFTGKIYKKLS